MVNSKRLRLDFIYRKVAGIRLMNQFELTIRDFIVAHRLPMWLMRGPYGTRS